MEATNLIEPIVLISMSLLIIFMGGFFISLFYRKNQGTMNSIHIIGSECSSGDGYGDSAGTGDGGGHGDGYGDDYGYGDGYGYNDGSGYGGGYGGGGGDGYGGGSGDGRGDGR